MVTTAQLQAALTMVADIADELADLIDQIQATLPGGGNHQPPGNVRLVSNDQTTATVDFDVIAGTGVTYNLRIKPVGGTYSVLPIATVADGPYTFTGLTASVQYIAGVSSVIGGIESTLNEVSFTQDDAPAVRATTIGNGAFKTAYLAAANGAADGSRDTTGLAYLITNIGHYDLVATQDVGSGEVDIVVEAVAANLTQDNRALVLDAGAVASLTSSIDGVITEGTWWYYVRSQANPTTRYIKTPMGALGSTDDLHLAGNMLAGQDIDRPTPIRLALPTPAFDTITAGGYSVTEAIADNVQKNLPAGYFPAIGPRSFPGNANSLTQWGSDAGISTPYAGVDCYRNESDMGCDGLGRTSYPGQKSLAARGALSGDNIQLRAWTVLSDAWQLPNDPDHAPNSRQLQRRFRILTIDSSNNWTVEGQTADSNGSGLWDGDPDDLGGWYNFWLGYSTTGAGSSASLTPVYNANFLEGIRNEGAGNGFSIGSVGLGSVPSGLQSSNPAVPLTKYRMFTYHTYPLTIMKTAAQWQALKGVLIDVQAQIVKHNPAGPDDSASAALMINVGGDFYNFSRTPVQYVSGFGNNRWRSMTSALGTHYFTDVPKQTLIDHPPPGYSA